MKIKEIRIHDDRIEIIVPSVINSSLITKEMLKMGYTTEQFKTNYKRGYYWDIKSIRNGVKTV